MSEETFTSEEQSHYEISLTAGQAFVAFVLLLLSLAASFAFGLMIGRGQGDERLVVKKEPTVVTEASIIPKKNAGKIVELGVAEDDFNNPATKTDTTATAPAATETTATAAPLVTENPAPAAAPAPVALTPTTATSGPAYAQLLSTGDQKTAEALAAKLINNGFTNAYVERTANEKGPIFRVRVKFASESEARASEAKLKVFSNDVWITVK
ncbi:MAG TPA: SPOR domain-containing protein [Thermoanaerobaculia bacterium]|jgi:cell division septation protein DedD|nr:SPOR domain-containing protein [Thermoanaerobaculia bacterium]